MRSKQYKVLGMIILLCLISCGSETLPKPKAMLRLEYPDPSYDTINNKCPYTFEKNKIANVQKPRVNRNCWFNLDYPSQKATIYISYYAVRNNLDSLLRDAQNITQEHVVKADAIKPEAFLNPDNSVFGMINKVSGNAASTTQFYVTDSIRHFISGSVYFRTKPNYDSILPAAHYLYNDVKHMIETLQWKN